MVKKSSDAVADVSDGETSAMGTEVSTEQAADSGATDGTAAPVVEAVKSEADLAFDELKEAAESGSAALDKELVAKGELDKRETQTLTPEQKAMDEAERRRRNIARAASQRTRGQAELVKPYAGAMSVKHHLIVYDLSVAAVAERFLGEIDKSLYVINRQGERAIGAKETQKILERMTAQIEEFSNEAKNERAQVKILLEAEKSKAEDVAFGETSSWLDPEYQSTAVEVTVHLKHPDSIRMVKAMRDFDGLIHDLTILNWNGVVDKARVDQIRQRQNRLAFGVFLFAIKAVNGLYKRVGAA